MPGTPSSSTWPRARNATSASSITVVLPDDAGRDGGAHGAHAFGNLLGGHHGVIALSMWSMALADRDPIGGGQLLRERALQHGNVGAGDRHPLREHRQVPVVGQRACA